MITVKGSDENCCYLRVCNNLCVPVQPREDHEKLKTNVKKSADISGNNVFDKNIKNVIFVFLWRDS